MSEVDWFGEWGPGIHHEKAVINLHVVYDRTAGGDCDDSACFLIERELMKYHGVKAVRAQTVISRVDVTPDGPPPGDSTNRELNELGSHK